MRVKRECDRYSNDLSASGRMSASCSSSLHKSIRDHVHLSTDKNSTNTSYIYAYTLPTKGGGNNLKDSSSRSKWTSIAYLFSCITSPFRQDRIVLSERSGAMRNSMEPDCCDCFRFILNPGIIRKWVKRIPKRPKAKHCRGCRQI